jgi:hypothetical protein
LMRTISSTVVRADGLFNGEVRHGFGCVSFRQVKSEELA